MNRVIIITMALLASCAVHAVTPDQCDRIVHSYHAGEAEHRDLGDGRVMWLSWWSLEGAAETLNVMDCGPGEVLRARTAEENMGNRLPFDRTEDAMSVIARHETGSRLFATLERMADDLAVFARDVRVETATEETCACAAFYPDARGDRTEFRLEGL